MVGKIRRPVNPVTPAGPRPARHTYPLLLDVTDRLVVIVGGGAVAVRKAVGLLEAGATKVRCVSPTFDADLPATVERVAGAYEPRHLDGAGLVFACTDQSEVNDAVVRDARRRGVLVSRADSDDETPGDFITPAKLRQGPVIVTVSAGSPALAVLIRDGIAERWDARWSKMAEAMQVLRPLVLQAHGLDGRRRASLFRDLATAEAMNVLDDGGIDALKQWLARKYPGTEWPLNPEP